MKQLNASDAFPDAKVKALILVKWVTESQEDI